LLKFSGSPKLLRTHCNLFSTLKGLFGVINKAMHFRLLIGTGVVTVFVLTGTIYGFTYWVGRVTTAENFSDAY